MFSFGVVFSSGVPVAACSSVTLVVVSPMFFLVALVSSLVSLFYGLWAWFVGVVCSTMGVSSSSDAILSSKGLGESASTSSCTEYSTSPVLVCGAEVGAAK